mmetsp:Transcript_6322/g.9547  ORF Transcript_6322/g.9547 Transcript_6322/m.9547 type:complete len:150 (-) Transcript_6322:44-493(-)
MSLEDIKKKKSKKKDNKHKKKRKHKHSDDERSSYDDTDRIKKPKNTDSPVNGETVSLSSNTEEENTHIDTDNTVTQKPAVKSKADFFASLLAREKAKPPIGTFHAVGKKADTEAEASKDWTCPKCMTSNYRHSHQCQKCKAIKRLSEWR